MRPSDSPNFANLSFFIIASVDKCTSMLLFWSFFKDEQMRKGALFDFNVYLGIFFLKVYKRE